MAGKTVVKKDYVVLAGDFASFKYEIDNARWEPNAEINANIEETWQKQIKEAAAKGAECVNNSMARVNQYSVSAGTLTLQLQPTDWRHFKGTMKYQEIKNTANPLSVGGITITSDGYIVAGRKSKINDIGVGQFQLAPCGYVNWEDVQKDPRNVSGYAMGRESIEELNVYGFESYTPVCMAGRPGTLQPMIIAELNVLCNKEELIEAHSKIEKKEIDELVFIRADPEDIGTFLEKRANELRPHLRCGLDMYHEILIDRKKKSKMFGWSDDGEW